MDSSSSVEIKTMKSFLCVSRPGCKKHWDSQNPIHVLQWALGQCRHWNELTGSLQRGCFPSAAGNSVTG